MILRRFGNKSKIAADIIQYFPPHSIYIEPFFGAGGLFFNKPRAKHNIVNDIDNEVFNLWYMSKYHLQEMIDEIMETPISQELFEYWKTNKEINNPIRKAIRFIYLTNISTMGNGGTFCTNVWIFCKKNLIEVVRNIYTNMDEVKFLNKDFREFFSIINFPHGENDKKMTFIYADKPYSNTRNNYSTDWTSQDDIDLLDILDSTNIKYAVSEFEGSHFESLALEKGLNKIVIGERQNLKNRRVEILFTNYEVEKNENLLF